MIKETTTIFDSVKYKNAIIEVADLGVTTNFTFVHKPCFSYDTITNDVCNSNFRIITKNKESVIEYIDPDLDDIIIASVSSFNIFTDTETIVKKINEGDCVVFYLSDNDSIYHNMSGDLTIPSIRCYIHKAKKLIFKTNIVDDVISIYYKLHSIVSDSLTSDQELRLLELSKEINELKR